MTIKDLEKEFLDGKIRWFDYEFETDEDYISISFNYNVINKCFEAGLSIYHASEDNNAENPEAHTDEEDFFGDSIEEILDEITEDYYSNFKVDFISYLEGKEVSK